LICIGDGKKKARPPAETSSDFSTSISFFFRYYFILLDRNSHDSLYSNAYLMQVSPRKDWNPSAIAYLQPCRSRLRSARDVACHMECLNFLPHHPLLDPVTQASIKNASCQTTWRAAQKGGDSPRARLSCHVRSPGSDECSTRTMPC
jgi:hypothetical protein